MWRVLISIATNLPGLRSVNALNQSTRALYSTFEKLATGRRINRASDDPSGMISAEHLRARQAEIEEQLKSMEMESSRLASRDGAYSAVGDLMLDLEEAVVSAASTGTMTEEERAQHQRDIDSIIQSIDFVAATSRSGGDLLLQGLSSESLGRMTLRVPDGSGGHTTKTYSLADLKTGGELDLSSGKLEFAQSIAHASGLSVSQSRAAIGNRMNDLDSQARTLTAELEGVVDSRSRIVDADFAAETANLVRNQVLQAAALYTAQMAIQQNAGVALALLGGAS